MKGLFILLALIVATNCFSQQRVKTDTLKQVKTDTVKKDSAVDVVKVFVLAMPRENWEALIKLIQTADEKPSVIREWTALIANNAKEFTEPKKK